MQGPEPALSAELHHFRPSGGVPNSRLPLAFWPKRIAGPAEPEAVRALYRRNGWTGSWVYTVFPYWHFHTHGHEVLTCVSGSAQIGLGGEGGIVAEISKGDVTVIPAGVGHKRIEASQDFLMAGAYPPGQSGNIVRPGDFDARASRRRDRRGGAAIDGSDQRQGRWDRGALAGCIAALQANRGKRAP